MSGEEAEVTVAKVAGEEDKKEDSIPWVIQTIKQETEYDYTVPDFDKMEVDGSGGSSESGNEDEEENGNKMDGGDYVFIQNVKQEMPSSSEEETSPKKKEGGGEGGASTSTATAKTTSTSTTMSPPACPEKKVIRLNPALSNIFKSPPPPKEEEKKKEEGAGTDGGGGGAKGGGGGGGASSNSEFLKASLALAAALKSEPKKKVFCANTNCNMKTDTVFETSVYGKLYFGMKTTGGSGGGVKICGSCYKKAEGFEKEAKRKVLNKENLFDLKMEIQTSESHAMIDLDSPSGSPVPPVGGSGEGEGGGMVVKEEEEMYQVNMNKLNELVNGQLGKWEVKEQVVKCVDKVEKDADELADQFATLDMQLDQLRNKIEDATKLYNEKLARKPKIVEVGSVHIGVRGFMMAQANPNLAKETQDINRASGNLLKKTLSDLMALDNAIIPEHQKPRNPLPPMPPNLNRMNFPPGVDPARRRKPHQLIFVQPKLNQEVYAMHKHMLCYFLPAVIVRITNPMGDYRPAIYTVQFSQKVKARSSRGDEADCFQKDLTGKQIAFKKASALPLPVGTRVVAKFKDLLKMDAEVDGMLYAGIIAEVPREVNTHRYLVFFDDGYAQYCQRDEVFPMCESSCDIWQDVHRNVQEFVKDYVISFPNRHMIRACIGSSFTVELNGEWLLGRILEIDSSLLKMEYIKRTDGGSKFEWIYRGSTRLGPLYNRMKTLKARPTITVARRHTYSNRRSNFSFEVSRMDNATGGPSDVGVHSSGPIGPVKGGVIRARDGKIINTKLESEGNMIKIQVPRDCPIPKKYVPHRCSEKCGVKYEEDSFRKVSPLAVPFYLGWAREIGKCRSKVFYHSPCGVRLGSYEEVHNYITETGVGIPIDFFSMEPGIDCLNEFEPLRRIEYLKDISYGKEWTPVTCVNSLDHDLPAYMEYITQRIEGKGVKINGDDEFLVCCDCEDDCTDKEKCACWQMTLSGISFKIARKEGWTLEAYENRRLKNHVLSGIYECNRKCKCRQSTCFNRVVQNKVKWPIQMFKTVAKGWGVRALHDMPRGSFICVYTGQLLTDAGANESGIEAGDEYLAELDFIECNEQIKEDYEEDCTDIESEEPGTRTEQRAQLQQQLKQNLRGSGGAAVQATANGQGMDSKVGSKKPTIQKAVKSTGGGKLKSFKDGCGVASPADSTHSCYDGITIPSTHPTFAKKSTSGTSISSGLAQATARKSGSKNGGSQKSTTVGLPSPSTSTVSSGTTTTDISTSSSSSGGSVASRTRRSASKDYASDDDDEDDDDIQVYSSFSASAQSASSKNAPRLPLREYFGKEEAVYIMDAKSMGNFGRYLNHSCDPNVFVQNLFVDTHDPRFPWVAFFTKKDVKAGTELTWDYNYDIGSVPGKTLYCYCYSDNCRRRLL